MNIYNILGRSIYIVIFIFQIVNTLMVLFRSIQTAIDKKRKKVHILTASSGFYWLIFFLSAVSALVVLTNFGSSDIGTRIVILLFLSGHILCTVLLCTQLCWRIEFSGNTVTVYKLLKKASFNREKLSLRERRFTVSLLSEGQKITNWDCRCVNIEEEANLYRFILNGK